MVLQGTITKLDAVSRELLILVNGEVVDVDVPVTCPVYVNEERVKLRLLQPSDHVVIDFKADGARAVAESIKVRPACEPIPK